MTPFSSLLSFEGPIALFECVHREFPVRSDLTDGTRIPFEGFEGDVIPFNSVAGSSGLSENTSVPFTWAVFEPHPITPENTSARKRYRSAAIVDPFGDDGEFGC